MLNHRRLAAALTGAGAIAALGFGATWAAGGGSSPTDHARGALDGKRPKNVILLIGDGMGDSEITLARYYGVGAEGTLNMEMLPFAGELRSPTASRPVPASRTRPTTCPTRHPRQRPGRPGRRRSTPVSRRDRARRRTSRAPTPATRHVRDRDKRGKRVGNVSTAEITDATPAALASHVSQRACQGPKTPATSAPPRRKAAAGWARSPSSRSTTCSTSTSAAVATASPRRRRGRHGDRLRQTRATATSRTASDLDAISRTTKPAARALHPGNMTTEFKPPIAAPTPGTARRSAARRPTARQTSRAWRQ